MKQFRLDQTCGACPEQYDVYIGEDKVGYLRLRNGNFQAECQGKVVYESETQGNGMFYNYERNTHLNRAVKAIQNQLENVEETPDGWIID